jgi:hypothetical protein
MRHAIIAACVVALSILAGCGSSGGSAQPADGTPTALSTSAAVAAQPTLPAVGPTSAAPGLPTQETAMPTEPPPTPEGQPSREPPTAPPAPTRPAFHATSIPPANRAPTQAANPPSGAPAPTVPPGLEPLVDQAKADLAQRQSTSVDAIEVVEVQSVVWPDASLGCPKPGMAYPQVQTDGLLIRLSVGGEVYEYHSGGGKPPFLCEQKP